MSHRRDVWRIDRAGSLDRLARRTEELPAPAPGQARVIVKAIGLNFADLFACLGLYSATPKASFIPGLEIAGVVDALGPPVPGVEPASGPQVGDKVVGLTRFGGYATAINLGIEYLRPIRTGWSFLQAAAYPVQALTAWYGLVELGALEPGELVLVQSAAGGVGLNALSIIQASDARAIAVVGSEKKRQWLAEHRGLETGHTVVRDRRRFAADLDRALSLAGATGFDLVFDAVGGPYLLPAFARLRPEGRLVTYGAADFMTHGARPNYVRLIAQYLRRPRIDPLRMTNTNRSVMGFNLIWLWDKAERLGRAYDELDRLIAAPPLVGHTFPFGEAPAAMRYLQSGGSIGKVVVDVGA